ncbi:MAG TPA: M48 family metalloprotease [Solirubrobacteraceae bacterium]|jgi:Zn-dependent protease with chaperone function|nr:M48 family metalloprotease [Solirubrobacteraceae bacterium]
MLNTTTNPLTRVLGAVQAVSLVGIGLYAITLAAHWFSAVARWLILYIALGLIALITGWPIPVEATALALALAPLAISLLALICPPLIAPLDGRWWEISTGGRPPEQDEREAFQHAIHQLQQIDPNLCPPRHWFVAEEPGQNAAAYSSSLRIDRGLLESPNAAAVIAHELGHLRTNDAHLTSALNLLLLIPMDTPALYPLWSLPLRGLAWVASGQAVQWLTANAWETYWRSREFAADQYAAHLGQGPALAQTLEHSSLPYERSIRNMRFSRASHPYTKPRIAKLRAQPNPNLTK